MSNLLPSLAGISLTITSYQWCGDNTYEGSGYDTLVRDYGDYSLPVFFTEFGCNESPPRMWQEIESLYSSNMTNVFSGGLVYEYTQEENKYGLVDVKKNGAVETRKDFTTLIAAYKKVPNPTIPKGAVSPTRPATCPEDTDPIFDNITANLTLPFTLAPDLITNGVSDKVKRGGFVSLSTRATTFNIVMDGKMVSSKEVKQTFGTTNAPLKAGGHGQNTGGEEGGDTASSTTTTSGASDVVPRGVAFVGSLTAVALAFGLFM